MRTTIKLADDVARAVEALRREEGLGISAAINELARRGLAQSDRPHGHFTQRVSEMGRPRISLDDIGEALEILEGDTDGG